MATKHRKTFQEILREEAPKNALKLEKKAWSASWLAKLQVKQSRPFYSIKDAALRQLFRIPGQKPAIIEAQIVGNGFLLSLVLNRTRALLHMPFDQLSVEAQAAEAFWVMKCASGQKWPSHRIEETNDATQIRRAS